jgi:hypothetical protein
VSGPPTPLIESLLAEAGFTLAGVADREGVLGEDEARIVWATLYTSPGDLIESWEVEQAWLVDFVGDRVSFEKSWELYLVLGSELGASGEEMRLLADIRADTTYARKIMLPGLSSISPARVRDLLAALRPLTLDLNTGISNALALLEDNARREQRVDVLTALERYRDNRPLFETS